MSGTMVKRTGAGLLVVWAGVALTAPAEGRLDAEAIARRPARKRPPRLAAWSASPGRGPT